MGTQSTTSTESTRSAELLRTSPVAPARDYQKVANSITRVAVPAGVFKGKCKQLYDFLYSKTRGSIVPSRSVRLTRREIMLGSDIGSTKTLFLNLRHLRDSGLVTWDERVGPHEGNVYTIHLPEEIDTMGTQSTPGTQSTQSTESASRQKVDRVLEVESTQSTHSLSAENAGSSGEAKTFIKTNTERADDEAFADLLAVLKQTARKVTGKESSPAERGRWKEVAELLATELEVAASRTTVTSAPAFLAEHLRRRLRKADARQIEREVVEASSKQAAGTSKPELTPEQIQEQVNLMAGLMRDGAEMRELEEQFAANFRPAQWHMIRSITLAQSNATTTKSDETKK
jgi:RNA polymerase-interacting CarD/CdnL/TRCF family regulator